MQRFRYLVLLTCLLALSGVAGAEPPRPDDLSGEDRFVPFYEWWLDERPDESEVVLEAYRSALGRAPDDPEEAAVAVADLEARLDVADTCVQGVQDRLLQRLVDHDPQALLPILHLSHQVFLEHVRHSRIWLADATRLKLERWAELYVDALGTPESKLRASRALSAFANLLRRVQVEGMLEQSTEALEHAARYAPDHPTILHLQGMHWELLDEPEKALDALERLQSSTPDDPVVRLRLGRALAQAGRTEPALTWLGGLQDPSVPAWVERLAVQERIRILHQAGRPEEARAVLETGLDRFPADPRLAVARAAERRLTGDALPGDTADLLEDFSGDLGPSPRLIYEAGPFEAVEVLKGELEDDVWEAEPRLTEALEHDFQNLWSEHRPRSLRRQARYSRCRMTSNPQLPEYLR